MQRRPARVLRQVGLQEGEASWKPLAKGTALFSYGYSSQKETPSHSECFSEKKESDEQQRAFSFHTVQTDLACEKGPAFHTENSEHQLYVSWVLDAQELWAFDEQLKHFADMLTHIPTVDSGMEFSQQVQDSSLQVPTNPSVLRSL